MTLILFVAVMILAVLLVEMKQRLGRLERDVRDRLTAYEIDRWRAIGAGGPLQQPPERVQSPPLQEPASADADENSLHEEAAPAAMSFEARQDIAALQAQAVHETGADEAGNGEVGAGETAAGEIETADLAYGAEPETGPDESRRPTGFEDLFGRRLPIWAGGITLLVAAVLLVKYSIDAGLLSPWVRVTLGLLFGGALIGAAEGARRMARFVQDERVGQALAGAGVGALFAGTLAANSLYGLIGSGAAFAGLSLITALAMALALRFGIACAVLALVGGLATPALIQSGAPNVPLLSGYLAMVIGSLTLLSRRQRWVWLGALALAGGMGWTALLILTTALDHVSLLTVGLLVLLLGLALPFLSWNAERDARQPMLQTAGAVAAALQLALLVSFGGYDALSWGLYALLSLAFLWLTGRVEALRPFLTLPLAAGLILTALWPSPASALFAAVMAGHLLIFGGGALWRLWREDGATSDAGRIALVAVAGYLVTGWQFGLDGGIGAGRLALLGLAFALLPTLGAAQGWRREECHGDIRFPLLVLASGLLLILAGLIGLPAWMAPLVIAGISALLLLVAIRSDDVRISAGALIYLFGALLALLGTGLLDDELRRLARPAVLDHPVQALVRWGGLTLVWGLFAWRHADRLRGPILTGIAAALGYGFIAQIAPAPWLALAAAGLVIALAGIVRRYPAARLQPALLVLATIAGLWMLAPVGLWLLQALPSLAGEPMLAVDLPPLAIVLRQLLVPAGLIAIAAWMLGARLPGRPRGATPALLGFPLLVGVHSLYKRLFAIDGLEPFMRLGLAERTVWEIALIAAGLGLWRWTRQREAALVLVAMGLAHNLLYTLALHNPLWTAQAVGAWPVANLLLPAFGIAFGGRTMIGALMPTIARAHRRTIDAAQMIVLLLFAYASLRQLFCGSLLAGVPVGQVESIFWSVLAIALALGWLLWGIRRAARSWRIGSLLLMLAAVAKVFLIDASGLEGLLRVASFLALGFSLIGLGWLYSRFLRVDAPGASPA